MVEGVGVNEREGEVVVDVEVAESDSGRLLTDEDMTRNEFDEGGGELWMEAEDKFDNEGVEQVDVNIEQLVATSVSVPSSPLVSLNDNGSSETYDRRKETG